MSVSTSANSTAANALKVACSSCNLRELCLPVGFSECEIKRLDALVKTRRTVRRGDALFRTGGPFTALYAVRTGFFKTRIAFLLNLTERLRARGFSESALVLRMSRAEIGSFLGLKLETVSRAFSKLQDDGVLEVKQRHVRVLDASALRRLVDGAPAVD